MYENSLSLVLTFYGNNNNPKEYMLSFCSGPQLIQGNQAYILISRTFLYSCQTLHDVSCVCCRKSSNFSIVSSPSSGKVSLNPPLESKGAWRWQKRWNSLCRHIFQKWQLFKNSEGRYFWTKPIFKVFNTVNDITLKVVF